MHADDTLGRRALLRAGAGAAAAAASGSAAAQDGTDTPTASPTPTDGSTPTASPSPTPGSSGTVDYGGWFSDTSNFDGTVDRTGMSEVTVDVGAKGNDGAFAFAPAAVRVDPGTTVRWEWTGKGGQHNVKAKGGAYASEIKGSGSYAVRFDGRGVSKYLCVPHQSVGMKGAVVVGDADGSGGTPEASVVQSTATPGGGGGGGEGAGEEGGSGEELDLPPNLELYGAALVVAVLSPIFFAILLGISYDPETGEREP